MSIGSRRHLQLVLVLAASAAALCGLRVSVAASESPTGTARPGTLDQSFGNGGILTAGFGTEPTAGSALAVVADPRGRLLVLEPGARGVTVARRFRDGRLDPSFGDGGIAIDRFGACAGEGSIGLGPGGTIVASCSGAIVRFTAFGAIDRSFGDDGHIRRRFETYAVDFANSVVDADGGVIVMYADEYGATAVRYEADGSLDRSYGRNGHAVFRGPTFRRGPVKLSELPDGDLLFAAPGTVELSRALVVGRLDPAGHPDPGFGDGGFTSIPALREGPAGIALLPDGSFYVAGVENRFVHVSVDGVWDTAFAGDGIASGPAKLGSVGAIVATPAGGLLATGTLAEERYGSARLLLERLTAAGAPDPAFGRNGFVSARPDPGRRHEGKGLLEMPDGSVVVVGVAGSPRTDNDPSRLTLAAFGPDGRLEEAFGRRGFVLAPGTSTSSDSVAALLVDRRGRTTVTGRAGGRSAVVRYGPRGHRDPAFGDDGIVDLPVLGDLASASGTAIAATGSEGLLVGVGSYGGGGIFRLGPGGGLDNSFGVDGIAGRGFRLVSDLLPTRDGGFLASGQRGDGIVARFGVDGEPRRGFGRDGAITVTGWESDIPLVRSRDHVVGLLAGSDLPAEYGPGGHRIKSFAPDFRRRRFRRLLPKRVEDLAFDPQGRLLVAGVRNGRIVVDRLLRDGTLDPTFGAGGVLTVALGQRAEADRIAVEADGRIVVAGVERPCDDQGSCRRGQALVLRFLPDGTPDRSFADGGRFVDPHERTLAIAALALSLGAITVGGTELPRDVADQQFFLARLRR